MKTSPAVVFFGNEQLCTGIKNEQTPLFDALLDAGYTIAAVVLRPDAPRGRSKQPVASLIKRKAIEHNIPVVQPQKSSELAAELQPYSGSIAVLAAFGHIVPQNVLDIFEPYGIVNVHPSLLPRYRGSSPIETAILNGDAETGVSLMRLDAAMDEGPIFGQTHLALDGTETKFDLYHKLMPTAISLLLKSLPKIISNQLEAKPQQTDGVSYTSLLSKKDGVIDPLTETASEIERKVRAHLGFPKSHVKLQNDDVIITSAKVSSVQSDSLPTLSCKDGNYIHIVELIASNGKRMSGDAYLRGKKN